MQKNTSRIRIFNASPYDTFAIKLATDFFKDVIFILFSSTLTYFLQLKIKSNILQYQKNNLRFLRINYDLKLYDTLTY